MTSSQMYHNDTFTNAMIAGEREIDNESLILKVQACVMDTNKCLPWNEVHACPAIKFQLRVLFDDLDVDIGVSRELGAPTNGLLFYGRPGTGKTILALAMAREFNYTVYEVSPAEVLSKWQGESEKFVETLFEQAVANQPAIIFVDEIDWLTRRRVSSDTASTIAIRSTLLRKWSELEKQQHRVVVVGTTSIPDQIATAFLGLFGTKFWIRGPEGPERFAIAKTLLSKVFHDVELEPKPLSSNGTKSLYALLTEVDARGTIIKLTGAEIAQAIRSVKQGLHRDLYNTRSWVKIMYKGEELLIPNTNSHNNGEVLEKGWTDLTKDERKKVARRPISKSDLEIAIKAIKPSQPKMEAGLRRWNMDLGTQLYQARKTLGIDEGYNY